MAGIPEQVRRHEISSGLRTRLDATIQERVDRYLEVSHQGIIPSHHFAGASAQCIHLYTDGYFLSAVMVTQAVAEGIRRFIVERNGITLDNKIDGPACVALLVEKGIISSECADAFNRIWRSFRNDVHHMNPKVAEIPFPKLAKGNIKDLATIEREVFAFRVSHGKLIPVKPTYWDCQPNGTVPVFLRLHC